MPIKKEEKKKFDIISIGEAGLDIFAKVNEASLLCSIHKDNCWLCFTYADKIPIDNLVEELGHNACNNAVGSARLGLRVALYSVIGDDDIGMKVKQRLKKEGVATPYIVTERHKPSNYSIVLNYQTERTILVYRQPHAYHLPILAPSKWIYLTSLGNGFEKIHTQVIKLLKKNGTMLAFNPGDRQLRAKKNVLEPILEVCTLLIVNKEEAGMLLGMPVNGDGIKKALHDLHLHGPQKVVITDGSQGAYGFDGQRYYRTKPLPSKVVERTGAGDSFSTGLIAALCHERQFSEALLWGAANAASVIEHIGPQKGLLTKEAILKRIKASKCCAKEIK